MRKLKSLILGCTLASVSTVCVAGQSSLSIVPIVTSCSQVAAALKIVDECKDGFTKYNLENETIVVEYSTKTPQKAFGKLWDVPIGSVLSVIRIPKTQISLTSLGIDLTTYEALEVPNDLIDVRRYSCSSNGVSVLTDGTYVLELMLTPGTILQQKICPVCPKEE